MTLTEHMDRAGLSDADVADRLEVSAEAVRLWRKGKRQITAARAVEIERIFGMPRHELRPDLWAAA